jgi:protein-S-isoprenylcysteine O-methyltransferase Ste14
MSVGTPFLTRWRVRLGYPVAIVFFLVARPSVTSVIYGAIVGIAGLLIRGAAAGYLYKHEGLAVNGPYGYTRNPLYFGSALLAAGLLMGGRSWLAAVVVAAYFLAFYPGVIKREEGELRAHYGAQFDEYAAHVPLFWPSLRGYRSGDASPGFSWPQYRRNREYQALLGFIGVVALLWIVMRIRG